MIRLISLAILFGVVSVHSATLNYFVSPTGNDGNSGLTAALPWTLQKALNKQDYNVGDDVVINLLAGTYTGADAGGYTQLTVNGGAQNGRMYVAPYRGADAKINVRNVRYHNTAYNAGSARWANGKITWTDVLFQDTSLTSRNSVETNEGGQSEFFNGGNRSPESLAPDGNSFAENAQYIRCTWYNTLQALGGPVWNRVENCRFVYVGRNPYEHGLYIGWNFAGYNPVVRGNLFCGIAGHPIKVSNGGIGLTIEDNVILDTRALVPNAGGGQYAADIYIGGTSIADNLIIQRNALLNRQNSTGSVDSHTIKRGIMMNGIVTANPMTIANNNIFGNGYSLIMDNTASRITNLLFRANSMLGYTPNAGLFPNGLYFIKFDGNAGLVLTTPNWTQNSYTLYGSAYNVNYRYFAEYKGVNKAWTSANLPFVEPWINSTFADGNALDVSGSFFDRNFGGLYTPAQYLAADGKFGLYTTYSPDKRIIAGNAGTAPLTDKIRKWRYASAYSPTTYFYITNTIIPTGNDPTSWTVSAPTAAIGQAAFSADIAQLHAVTAFKVPNPPTSSQATRTGNNVAVTWVGTADTDYNKFRVYRSVDGGAYSLLNTTADHTVLSYADNGVAAGSTYRYRVVQVDDFTDSLHTDSVNVLLVTGSVASYVINGRYHEF